MPFSSSFFSSLDFDFSVAARFSAEVSAGFSLRCWATAGKDCRMRVKRAAKANNDMAMRGKRMRFLQGRFEPSIVFHGAGDNQSRYFDPEPRTELAFVERLPARSRLIPMAVAGS